ncbi:hypothetical protein [Bacillus cereus group sp. TH254-2LC]|uniref:hypothetical protein n=1 Tax=Bacillus cereus group sp. TH254-2LC TaxID=3018042 RepID=UPI0022E6F8D2|nr:hypothetical protein [Bacillus cereus group sp. TH254-2LC]
MFVIKLCTLLGLPKLTFYLLKTQRKDLQQNNESCNKDVSYYAILRFIIVNTS